MAQASFNKKSVDPATAQKLGEELLVEAKKMLPDFQRIEQLVMDGANIEIVDADGNTPMLAATLKGRSLTSIKLLDLGANANAVGHEGITGLIIASFAGSTGDLGFAQKLLDKGAETNKHFFKTKTALMWAAHRGFRIVASEIARRGGDILQKSTGQFPMNAIEWAEDNNKKGAADDLRLIQQNKEQEAATKLQEEQLRAEKLAAQIKQQELRAAIADVVYNHGEVEAPEKASFPKRVRRLPPADLI